MRGQTIQDSKFKEGVDKALNLGWSPEQIAKRLNEEGFKTSRQTIHYYKSNFFKKQKNIKKENTNLPKLGSIGTYRNILSEYDIHVKEYNPETITIQTFNKMLEDSQVWSAFNTIRYVTLFKGFVIDIEEEGQEDIRDFVEAVFNNMESEISEYLREMLTAIVYGFSVAEIIIKPLDFEGSEKWGIDSLNVYDPDDLTILRNRNTEKFDGVIQYQPHKNITIPPEKCLLYSYNKQFGNMYGSSDLKRCYKEWWCKQVVEKFWNIYVERYAFPKFIGKTLEKNFDNLETALEKVGRYNASFVIDRDDDIERLDVSGKGAEPFAEAVKYRNQQIARTMLIPDLTIAMGEHGSYALGKSHQDLFLIRITSLQKQLEGIMNDLIKRIVVWNYGPVDVYPTFEFNPLEEDDLKQAAETFKILVEAGIVMPEEEFIRDRLQLPKREDEYMSEDEEEVIEEEGEEESEAEKQMKFKQVKKKQDDEVDKLVNRMKTRIIQKIRKGMNEIKDRDYLTENEVLSILRNSSVTIVDLQPLFIDALTQGWDRGVKEIKIDQPYPDKVETLSLQYAKRVINGYNTKRGRVKGLDGLYKKLEKTIMDLYRDITQTKSISQLFGVELFSKFSNLIQNRAEQLADFEIANAFNRGYVEHAKATGIIKQLTWYTQADERVCEICGPMHGKVVKVDTINYNTLDVDPVGMVTSDIMPPAHVKCRCYLVWEGYGEEIIPMHSGYTPSDFKIHKGRIGTKVQQNKRLIKEFEQLTGKKFNKKLLNTKKFKDMINKIENMPVLHNTDEKSLYKIAKSNKILSAKQLKVGDYEKIGRPDLANYVFGTDTHINGFGDILLEFDKNLLNKKYLMEWSTLDSGILYTDKAQFVQHILSTDSYNKLQALKAIMKIDKISGPWAEFYSYAECRIRNILNLKDATKIIINKSRKQSLIIAEKLIKINPNLKNKIFIYEKGKLEMIL